MEIIQGVNMLECSKRGRIYIIEGEENILIDTGLPGLFDKILEELNTMDITPESIKHILLTHHDIDHIGNARLLQDATGASVWASKEDIPYITGDKKRHGIKRFMKSVMKNKIPNMNAYIENQPFNNIQVIDAPGHTPGHVILAYEGILFTGDLFKITNQEIIKFPKIITWDNRKLDKSIVKLKDLKFNWFCPGHGIPSKKGDVWERFIQRY